MKNAGACVKCASSDILRVAGQTGAFGSGNNIPAGRTVFSSVNVTRFVCAQCGYIEEWVESEADRQKLRLKYAQQA